MSRSPAENWASPTHVNVSRPTLQYNLSKGRRNWIPADFCSICARRDRETRVYSESLKLPGFSLFLKVRTAQGISDVHERTTPIPSHAVLPEIRRKRLLSTRRHSTQHMNDPPSKLGSPLTALNTGIFPPTYDRMDYFAGLSCSRSKSPVAFLVHIIEETLSMKTQTIKDTTQWNYGTKPNQIRHGNIPYVGILDLSLPKVAKGITLGIPKYSSIYASSTRAHEIRVVLRKLILSTFITEVDKTASFLDMYDTSINQRPPMSQPVNKKCSAHRRLIFERHFLAKWCRNVVKKKF